MKRRLIILKQLYRIYKNYNLKEEDSSNNYDLTAILINAH